MDFLKKLNTISRFGCGDVNVSKNTMTVKMTYRLISMRCCDDLIHISRREK